MNEARPILCWRAARLVSLELDLASELKRSLPCQRRGIFCGSSRAAFLLLPVTEKGPVEGFPLQVRYTSVFTVIMLFLQPKRMGSPPYFNISLHAIHACFCDLAFQWKHISYIMETVRDPQTRLPKADPIR
ncbi:uncharacterized protein LOC143820582 isoform X2 [Paroedura picta]|uniref:uncharacterized protein LOC143820582 isoform X2 n=1 Tax=Paroedura picta TaxID=143630 RepID=UPI00405605D2